MVRFSGMDPWKEDFGIIEVHSQGKLFDLHNFGRVIAVEYRPPDVLNFRFVLDEPPWDLNLQFLNVTDVIVRRTELTTQDPDQLVDVSFRSGEGGAGRFEVVLGDGMTYAFEATIVAALANQSPNASTRVCVKCNRRVDRHANEYETFEKMHWSCFHYEFEHDGDPDVACSDPSCPARAFDPNPRPAWNQSR